MKTRLLAAGLLLSSAVAAAAAPFPLPASAPLNPATELTAPFVLSDGLTQRLITNRVTLTAKGLPATFGLWDMSAFDKNSRNVFIPSEVGSGAGVFRYNLNTRTFTTLMQGNNSGVRTSNPALFNPLNDDFSRFDPVTYTPWNSLLVGEETTGGRLFEVENPGANGNIKVRWLSKVPAVAHEGLRFDSDGNLYFIDEDNSGSIYKYVPSRKKNLESGQTFVLKVTAFAGAASEVWNSATNTGKIRTGAATWVPITNKDGVALTAANPFAYVTTTGGRTAADQVNGTPFVRPEDMTFKRLANGNLAFFFTATSEHAVYKVELTGGSAASVGIFSNRNTIDLATSLAVGPAFANPDNIEKGADGTIYVIEDNEPGDIWKVIDANNDGVAETMGRWASLSVPGAEPTGFEQDPNDRNRFIVSVQHPTSGNDAMWEIRLPCPTDRHGKDDDRDEDHDDDDDSGECERD